eukprot:6410371-Prymnesium_polylepis.1
MTRLALRTGNFVQGFCWRSRTYEATRRRACRSSSASVSGPRTTCRRGAVAKPRAALASTTASITSSLKAVSSAPH